MFMANSNNGIGLRPLQEERMESNPELELAWQLVEFTGVNLFLTGKAGSGKTTFLRSLRERSSKRMVVLAPTGVAAMNAGGVTIHSFFQLPFAPFVPESHFGDDARYRYRFGREKVSLMRSIDLLVIDEISMVRADLLDAVDEVLRRYRDRSKPFGGVQLLMIGDLQQLSPVVKEQEMEMLAPYYSSFYFFGSKALAQAGYVTVELAKVYRQSNAEFLDILNAVRDNRVDAELLGRLNRRCIPGFAEGEHDGYICLTTHNHTVNDLNMRRLEMLPGASTIYEARIEGDFPPMMYPTEQALELKEGAQVMFVKNDVSGQHRYYNGMLGRIVALGAEDDDDDGVQVETETGETLMLEREEWANCKYTLDAATKEITETVLGTFSQYPLRLAWAITIHKSQGLTFDKAVIDVRRAFVPGQAYVALSRCRSLEGLVLSAPVEASSVISDAVVTDFVRRIPDQIPDGERIGRLRRAYFEDQVAGLFGFERLSLLYRMYVRLVDEHLYRLYPQWLERLKGDVGAEVRDLADVGGRFIVQCRRIVAASADYADDDFLQQRFRAAAQYLGPRVSELVALVEENPLTTDNAEVRDLADVGGRFIVQCRRIVAASADYADDDFLQQRFRAAAQYLGPRVSELVALVEENPLTTDNAEVKRRVDEATAELLIELRLKEALLAWVEENRFTVSEYLSRRNRLVIELAEQPRRRTKGAAKGKAGAESQDILHAELYETLRAWRADKASEQKVPAYTVLQQKALIGISNMLPRTIDALLEVPYVGKRSVVKYGDDLLEMVREYCADKRLGDGGQSPSGLF